MSITTTTGVVLEETETTRSVDAYAASRDLPHIKCYIAAHPNFGKEYVLVAACRVIYANTSLEAIGCHIDMMRAAEMMQ